MRNVPDKSCRENKNTHFIFSDFFIQISYRLCDNVEKYCIAGQATDKNIVWLMGIICWIANT